VCAQQIHNPRRSPKDEAASYTIDQIDSVTVTMMERVVERDNLNRALNQARRNKVGPFDLRPRLCCDLSQE
jgi:hypothetical protein